MAKEKEAAVKAKATLKAQRDAEKTRDDKEKALAKAGSSLTHCL